MTFFGLKLGSGLWEPCGTPPPRIPGNNPPGSHRRPRNNKLCQSLLLVDCSLKFNLHCGLTQLEVLKNLIVSGLFFVLRTMDVFSSHMLIEVIRVC